MELVYYFFFFFQPVFAPFAAYGLLGPAAVTPGKNVLKVYGVILLVSLVAQFFVLLAKTLIGN